MPANNRHELSKQQEMFVNEYIACSQGKKAAIAAGYKPAQAHVQASRLLTLPKIKEAIERKQRKIEIRTEITKDWIVNNLKSVVERCMQTEQVFYKGSPVEGQYQFEHAGANKALELLGKHLGMFTDKVEMTGKDGQPLNAISVTMTEQEAAQTYLENLKK
jgi:phage terminase small subunit